MLSSYYSQQADKVIFTSTQASNFAKQIAQDFNPLHDEDNKRFCVPGDLMFAIVLDKYGISQQMKFTFEGMVKEGVHLTFPPFENNQLALKDDKDKTYLKTTKSGETSKDQTFIEGFTREYVAFSGQTFPHILVPLMRQEGVMINPVKPLVIYQTMEINLSEFRAGKVSLECLNSSLKANGKRGNVVLEFCIKVDEEIIGTGEKRLIVGGLRAFDEEKIKQMIENYEAFKNDFQKKQA